jgi:adenylate kinase
MARLIVLMGPTGAGKSVQGDLLAQDLNGVHLSSGNLLRQDPVAAKMIANGKLAPAAEVERIMEEAVLKVPEDQAIILDGFPRTTSNLLWMDRELPKLNRTVTDVVLIELDVETCIARLNKRDRADDSPEAVAEKLEAYAVSTRPVVEHYEAAGMLKRVDGRGDIETVHGLVKDAIS